MTAELLAFPKAFLKPPPAEDAKPLLAAVVELHALLSIDPIMGASPTRVYFVFNPEAKRRIAASIVGETPNAPTAYALVAYDFAFALHLIEIAGRTANRERAKTIAELSAGLQAEAVAAAATALGVQASPVGDFDAEALKSTFFPGTQEVVVAVFGLELPPPMRRSLKPGIAQP